MNDAPRPHPRQSKTFHGNGRAKQSFKDECDINNIMARFEKGALLDHVNEFQGQYGDYTNVPSDFHQAMNQVRDAQTMFQTLPAKLRENFHNDPGQFIQFVENADEDALRQAGLLPPVAGGGGPPADDTSSDVPGGPAQPAAPEAAPAAS